PMRGLGTDLATFRPVNADLGHAAGDAVLRRLAALLRACARPGDVRIRLGGDEFVLWLPGLPAERAMMIGDALCKLFRRQMVSLGVAAEHAGLSIGLASTETDRADTADALLALADSRLYHAKDHGKGCVRGGDAA